VTGQKNETVIKQYW